MRTVHAAVLSSILLISFSASAVMAADPSPGGTGGPPPGDIVPPLSPEELAIQRLKEAVIADNIAAIHGGGMSLQACPTGTQKMAGTQEYCEGPPPRRVVLTVYPRQQEQCDWCAPAVAQIISNRSHGTSGNVHAQSSIAYWMGTSVMDCTGDGWADPGTCLGYFLDTLNAITVQPPSWDYIWKYRPSYSNWHNTIITGVHTWRLPLAATVLPWTLDNQYRLVSWPNQSHGGHYIELHGYDGFATSSGELVFFSDPAGWCGSGTNAGNWPQNSWVVHRVMWDHGYMVY